MIIGIFLLGFLKFGMGLLNVPRTVMNIASGLLLFLAILLPGWVQRIQERSRLSRARAL